MLEITIRKYKGVNMKTPTRLLFSAICFKLINKKRKGSIQALHTHKAHKA